MRLEFAGSTHVGMKRNHNEDSLLLLPEQNLFIVADGMGGHASGEVASRLAVETVAEFFKETAEDDEVTWPYKLSKDRHYEENRLINGVMLANLRIWETATAEAAKKGMGTTIVTTLFANGGAYVAHVGDSRIYRLGGGKIAQVTEDHSLLNDYLKMKQLTPEEIESFPHKNVIVRALGMKETVKVDTNFIKPEVDDIFLMCSDGLSGMISDDDMLRIVTANITNLEQACNELIAEANANGGVDNITVILARFLGN
ncbi:MAG: Stp1/IreP family PP2C-type Ser/Thr phosphatase [Myxococcota bacterium]|jgi:protein phosphatase|nr:Stp1/IreP family PP2C-type Ser/Thr phosphatase [Myxococcota bacterium]